MKFFNVKPELLQTNYPDLIEYLKNNTFDAEKISDLDEKHFQIENFSLYTQIYGSNQQDHSEIVGNISGDIREFALKWSSIRVQEASEQLDLHISQSINALDEIDKILNTVGTRMREWYGLHFPEFGQSTSKYYNVCKYRIQSWKAGRNNSRIPTNSGHPGK